MNKPFPFPPAKKQFSLGQGAIIALLLFILFGNVFFMGYRAYEVFTLNNPTQEKGIEKLAIIQSTLDKHYLYSEEVPYEQMFDGAAAGLAASLGDPYTRYISEREYEEFQIMTEGNFGGIGVSLSTESTNKGLLISNVNDGQVAQVAGLQPNDIIVEVDGEAIEGMNMEDAVALIRGEVGSTVTLKVMREGSDKPITIVIQRQKVELPNVSDKLIDGKYGYIHLARFSRDSTEVFDSTYAELEKNGMEALILDVRGNPGGLLSEATSLASRFIGTKEDVVLVKNKNFSTPHKTEETPYLVDIPVVLIVDQQSASAAEILAGALQSHGKAKVIGVQTYGKGLIQNTYKVDDESALVITVSEYLTVEGEPINGIGIKPDIQVFNSPEDILKGNDTQLQKSIEYLQEQKGE